MQNRTELSNQDMKLLAACEAGTLVDIEAAIAAGGNVQMKFDSYHTKTLMHVAAERKFTSLDEAIEIIGFLKESGLDIDARFIETDVDDEVDNYQTTPIILAADKIGFGNYFREEQTFALQALAVCGADFNLGYGKYYGASALHILADTHQPELVRYALDFGANPLRLNGQAQGFYPDANERSFYANEVKTATLLLIAREGAIAAGQTRCDFDFENKIPVPDAPLPAAATEKLTQLITAALTGEEEQFVFRGPGRAGYEDMPCSLPVTVAELEKSGIQLQDFGNTVKEQRRSFRRILQQIIATLIDNPEFSGGTSAYNVRIKNDADKHQYIPNNADVVFDIESRFVHSVRNKKKVKIDGSLTPFQTMLQDMRAQGPEVIGLSYHATGGRLFDRRAPAANATNTPSDKPSFSWK